MRALLLAICACWIASGTPYAHGVHASPQLHRTRQLQGSCIEHPQLVLVDEQPFSGMFKDSKGLKRFESSALAIVQGQAWVAFDNSFALGRLRADLHLSSSNSNDAPMLIGEPGAASNYEALTWDSSTGRMLAVVEGVKTANDIKPYVHELQVSADSSGYVLVQTCPVNFNLESDNKGFEGAHVFKGKDGGRYLIGLCEGNFCSKGAQGREPGNGRLIISKFNGKAADAGCAWDYVKTVNIPAEASFEDYSDLAFSGNQMAIISQTSSLLWLGGFDFDTLSFAPGHGKVYAFPRTSNCNIMYCTVEGIAFLGDGHFLVVSDMMKKPKRCQEHDQRISTFRLPA